MPFKFPQEIHGGDVVDLPNNNGWKMLVNDPVPVPCTLHCAPPCMYTVRDSTGRVYVINNTPHEVK